jgi:hypothetical protein
MTMKRQIISISLAALLFVAAGVFPATSVGAQAQSRPDLSGPWLRGRCITASNPEICPDRQTAAAQRTGPSGLVMLDSYLTARAKAFRDSFDEVAAPKYDCVPTAVPTLLTDPYPFKFEQRDDRVIITYEKEDIVRTVWLDGFNHKKPSIYEFFTHGYSTGKYEGGKFIVETTKFVFDPSGLDADFGNVPSSTQKRLIERYSLVDGRLHLDMTIEDPIFLLKPINYSMEWQKTDQELALPWSCDPESAKQNLLLQPSKYPDPPR